MWQRLGRIAWVLGVVWVGDARADEGVEPGATDEPNAQAVATPDPPALQGAIAAYNAKRFAESSQRLHALLGSDPEKAGKIQYYLGRNFLDLGMYSTAAYWFGAVAKRGPDDPYFNYAIPKLVAIARITEDESDLRDLATEVPPERFPTSSRNVLTYLHGVRLYDEGKGTDALKYLGQVSDKSDRYLQARYLEGVIYRRAGKLKSAVRSFAEVARYEATVPTGEALARLHRLRDLSLMDIARIYYGLDRLQDADTFYGDVPHDSPEWHRALLEDAWARYMMADLDGADRNLEILEGPTAPDEFFPEATLLHAIVHFSKGELAAIPPMLDALEARWRPVQEQLDATVARYSPEQGGADPAALYRLNYGPRPGKGALPASVRAELLKDRDLAGLVKHLGMLPTEDALVDKQPADWRVALGPSTHALLAEERARLEARAGRRIVRELAITAPYLRDVLYQASVVRFEALRATGDLPADVARLRAVREGAAGEARAEMTFKLAELLRGTGTPAERVTLYEQALQEAPTWERADEVSWQLALTLAEAGDPDRSEAQLTHLVEAWPTSGMVPDACMLLGDYSFERAHFEEARTRYTCTVERAPQLRPDLSRQVAYARYKLAWCAWALGDHAGAITMMREAVTMLGDDPALLAAAEQELAKLEAAAP